MQRIVCHGDSLTEGADVAAQLRWPALLQEALNIETINTGIGGDSTAGMLSRFPPDVVRYEPQMVIIMGGTNDFWWDLSLKTSISNLYTMAYQAQYHGIVPLFGLPIPFDIVQARKQAGSQPEAGFDRLYARIQQLNVRLKTLAESDQVPVIDFHGLFLDADRNVQSDCYLGDGVHPNEKGHRLMAAAAVSVVKSSGILDPGTEQIFT